MILRSLGYAVRSITANELQIAEGGEYEAIILNIAQMIIRSKTV